MPRTPNPKNSSIRCAHAGPYAVASGVMGDDEHTMSEPVVVCCGCGSIRWLNSWKPAEWTAPLGDVPPARWPEGAAMLVHEVCIRTSEDANRAARRAWELWVDAGGYGRRLLFGRLRPDEIERAEKDVATHAREMGR